MEQEILFPKINLFGTKRIAPLQISKFSRRRLKENDKLRSLKKEAGFEGAIKKGSSSSDRSSIPPLLDLQGRNMLSFALPPPEVSAGFDGSGDGVVFSMGEPPYQWMKCEQKMFPVRGRREGCRLLSILSCVKEDSTVCDLAQRGRWFLLVLSDMEILSDLDAASRLIPKTLLVLLD